MDKDCLTKGERTRRDLIRAARVLFARDGFAATGVDAIVRSIGLTSGVFYANFSSKEELLKVALREQIEASRELLLKRASGETSAQWLKRALFTYLSPQHRDVIEASCPITTMSQELSRLGLFHRVGLGGYIQDFEQTLRERLDEVRPGAGSLAPALMSVCVGGLQMARLQRKKDLSDLVLHSTREAALRLVFGPELESQS